MTDAVDHPGHYTEVVPGIECIQVTQHFNFNRGNAIKYLWRSDAKGDAVEDLRKAAKYIEFEIARLEADRAQMRTDLITGIGGVLVDPNECTTAIGIPPEQQSSGAKLFQFPPPPTRWHE